MSETTKIQWCDSTHNFWRGCRAVSAGCANCYAKKQVERFGGDFSQLVRSKDFNAPLRWQKHPLTCDCGTVKIALGDNRTSACPKCRSGYRPRRVFSLSLGDWLDPDVPIEWLADMLDVIRRCDKLEWILCTKRPELWPYRIRQAMTRANDSTLDFLEGWYQAREPIKNITILASVEDQRTADERIPHLLNIPAAIHGVSCEPLLGPLNIAKWMVSDYDNAAMDQQLIEPLQGFNYRKLKWCVIGGESGPRARPCQVEWVRDLVSDANETGCACFVKQLGKVSIEWNGASVRHHWNHPKGGDPAEWAEDLRVREFPK